MKPARYFIEFSLIERLGIALVCGMFTGDILPARVPFWVAACISCLIYLATLGTLTCILRRKKQ